jgi:hypothetical protein
MQDLFDREIRSLMKQSMTILKTRYSIDPHKKEIKALQQYLDLYEKLSKDNIVIYFQSDFTSLYQSEKSSLLSVLTDDLWLRRGDISIQYAGNKPELRDKTKHIKLYLSFIYKSACELQESAQKTVGQMSTITAGQSDLIYTSIFLLHLLRTMYAVVDDADKASLATPIEKLETDLQVKNRIIKKNATGANNVDIDSAFKSVYTMMAKVMKPDQADVNPPSWEQFGNILGNVISQPGVQEMFQKGSQLLQGDPNAMLDNVKNIMSNYITPEAIQEIQQTVVKTAQQLDIPESEEDV